MLDDITRVEHHCSLLHRGEINYSLFLERFTRQVVQQLGCSRASVWTFAGAKRNRTLRCLALFDSAQGCMTESVDLAGPAATPYLDSLLRDDSVAADDAQRHPATMDLFDGGLMPRQVESLLTVAISVNGTPFLAFSCDELGRSVRWTLHELHLLRQFATRASFALMHAAAEQDDTAPGTLWDPTLPARIVGRGDRMSAHESRAMRLEEIK